MSFIYTGAVCSDLEMIKNFVDKILKELKGIIEDENTIFDIKLILNELVINGVLHGNKEKIEKCVELFLEIKDNALTIRVKDEGTGIVYDMNKYNPLDLKSCGRGLIIVNGLSDEFYIEDNIVTSIKYI